MDGIERLPNGVAIRRDGGGDGWAAEHRSQFTNKYYMQDMDGVFGQVMFAQNTAERLFLEYEPDNYQNRFNRIRSFGVIAIFDRKKASSLAFDSFNSLSTAFYLFMCREGFPAQPVRPKFFYVVGSNRPPWKMIEINVVDSSVVREVDLGRNGQPWEEVWEVLGLTESRKRLREWLKSNKEPY